MGDDGYVQCLEYGDDFTDVKLIFYILSLCSLTYVNFILIKLFKEKDFIVASSHKDSNVQLLVAGTNLIQTL